MDEAELARARAVAAALRECGQVPSPRDVQRLADCSWEAAEAAARTAEIEQSADDEAPDPLPFAGAPLEEPPLPWGEKEETAAERALRQRAWMRRGRVAAACAVGLAAVAEGARVAAPRVAAWWRADAAPPPAHGWVTTGGPLPLIPTAPAWPRILGLSSHAQLAIAATIALLMLPPGNRALRVVWLLGTAVAAATVYHRLLQPLLTAIPGI